VRNYNYSPDAIEDESDDESYEQEQQTLTQGGRTPSEYSSAKSERRAENLRKYKARSRSRPGPDKRDLSDTVSYQDGRSSGNRSIPSSSRHSIQSHIPQHKESEQQARQKLYDQQVAQPVLAAGAEEEDIYGNKERYDNFSQQMREGNISGGAGGGSACISRSGGKQRQVVREVMSGPYTPEENTRLALGIRKYYKEVRQAHPDKCQMIAQHMGGTRTSDSIRQHLRRSSR
jgi:hypothetical protein